MLDVASLHEVTPPSIDGELKLLPLSLLLATYSLKDCPTDHHSPRRVVQERTILPADAEWIMKEIPVAIPCGFNATIFYNVCKVLSESLVAAALRLSILGDPGEEMWRLEGNCSSGPFQVGFTLCTQLASSFRSG